MSTPTLGATSSAISSFSAGELAEPIPAALSNDVPGTAVTVAAAAGR